MLNGLADLPIDLKRGAVLQCSCLPQQRFLGMQLDRSSALGFRFDTFRSQGTGGTGLSRERKELFGRFDPMTFGPKAH